jgi:hypothetical protein
MLRERPGEDCGPVNTEDETVEQWGESAVARASVHDPIRVHRFDRNDGPRPGERPALSLPGKRRRGHGRSERPVFPRTRAESQGVPVALSPS